MKAGHSLIYSLILVLAYSSAWNARAENRGTKTERCIGTIVTFVTQIRRTSRAVTDVTNEKIIKPIGAYGKNKVLGAMDATVSGGKKVYNFGKDLKRSMGLSLLMKNIPDERLAGHQQYGGFISHPKRVNHLSWKKNPFLKSVEVIVDAPQVVARHVIRYFPLKRLQNYANHSGEDVISISTSPGKNPTIEELAALEVSVDNLVNKKHPNSKVVLGFANPAFLKAKGFEDTFNPILNRVIPAERQERMFPEEFSYEEWLEMPPAELKAHMTQMRENMANRLEESGAHAYVIGDESAQGVAEEIKIYSRRNLIMSQVNVSPIAGVLEYWTTRPQARTVVDIISILVKHEPVSENSWFVGAKHPTMLGYIVYLSVLPIGAKAWAVYNKMDPLSRGLDGAGNVISEEKNKIDAEIERELNTFLLLNDPRFEDIKDDLVKGKIEDEHLNRVKTRVMEITGILKEALEGFHRPSFPTPENSKAKDEYSIIAKLIATHDSDQSNLEDIKKDVVSSDLNEKQSAVARRLVLLDNALYRDLALFTEEPKNKSLDAPWVAYYKSMGFELDKRKFEFLDLKTGKGLYFLDDLIRDRTMDILEFDLVSKFIKGELDLEKLSAPLKKRISKIVKSKFFLKVLAFEKNGKINDDERARVINQWLDFSHVYEMYQKVGIYRIHNDKVVDMNDIESVIEAEIDFLAPENIENKFEHSKK